MLSPDDNLVFQPLSAPMPIAGESLPLCHRIHLELDSMNRCIEAPCACVRVFP